MLDHVSIPVADIAASAAFYDAVLATVGLRRRKELPAAIGYGAESIARGARNAGLPGERPAYTQPFYGAFVFDLDGFKIEAVCRQ